MSAVQDQVVVVTGAARGIGAELCRNLARGGARVAVLGLEPELLADVAKDCRTVGSPDAHPWVVDVSDLDALHTVAAEVADRFGRVDAVVVNAGIATGGPLLTADMTAYDRVIEVNLLGSIRTAKAFLPALVASRGYLLQVASLAAIMPAPLLGAYCASKSGVEAFAHSLRVEMAAHGVAVGVGYLSWIDTDMVRAADENEGLRQLRAGFPFPFNRTYPLRTAVDVLTRAVAKRSVHAYAPWWLRGLPAGRGMVPTTTYWLSRNNAKRAQATLGKDASVPGLIGAGGAAADQA
jgi:NAD(P)-dependent dehydrogenase (short-subunit alcohol dehydrogenase family)